MKISLTEVFIYTNYRAANLIHTLSTWLVSLKDILLLVCNVTFSTTWNIVLALIPSYRNQITMEPLPPGNMGWPIIGETIDFFRKVGW